MVLRRFGIFDQNKVTWWHHLQQWLWRKIHMTSDDCHVLILLHIHLIPQIRIPSYFRGRKFINKHKLSWRSIFESLSQRSTRTNQLGYFFAENRFLIHQNRKNEKVKSKKLNRPQKFIFTNIATEGNRKVLFLQLTGYFRFLKSVLISGQVGTWLFRYCGGMPTIKGKF